jgi:hypothetical protein
MAKIAHDLIGHKGTDAGICLHLTPSILKRSPFLNSPTQSKTVNVDGIDHRNDAIEFGQAVWGLYDIGRTGYQVDVSQGLSDYLRIPLSKQTALVENI